MKDYYYILGITEKATNEEIKTAYRKLSLKFHPDKNDGDKYFEDRFKEINEANEVLSNSEKRKSYDNNRSNFFNQNLPKPKILLFTVDKNSINNNDVVTFKWNVLNADTVRIEPFGIVQASGEKKYKINSNKYGYLFYKLIAQNSIDEVYQELKIDIQPTQKVIPIINKFEADKYTLADGENLHISWQTSNATTVFIKNFGIIPTNGDKSIKLNFNGEHSLTLELVAKNEFTESTKQITILKKVDIRDPKENNAESTSSRGLKSFIRTLLGISIFIILIGIFLDILISKNAENDFHEPSRMEKMRSEIPLPDFPSKLKILSIKADNKVTTITFEYNNGNSTWMNIKPETYLKVGDERLKLIAAENIPLHPRKYEFQNPNQTILFKLIFPSIGDALYLDIIEDKTNVNAFNFKNVYVNRPNEANWKDNEETLKPSVGNVMFWSRVSNRGIITVTLNKEFSKEISVYQIDLSAPICGSKGFAIFEMKEGIYKFSAISQPDESGNVINWEGDVGIIAGECNLLELTETQKVESRYKF